MTETDLLVDPLVDLIHNAGRPVHLNTLSRRALRVWLEAEVNERYYAPGGTYEPGERIRFGEEWATVSAVQAAANPAQGEFSVLTIRLPDGSKQLMAAEIADAPVEEHQPVTEEVVDDVLARRGREARQGVRAALSDDPRFVSCSTPQGELWCLRGMLPQVTPEEVEVAEAVLPQGLIGGELVSGSTEKLAAAVWGLEDDGSDEYALYVFALRRALDRCETLKNLGDQWASSEAWEALSSQRQRVTSPRQPGHVLIPKGVEKATEAEVAHASAREAVEEEAPQEERSGPADLEAWRSDRPDHAVFTLRARHYHEGWLPLSRKVRRLFPPLGMAQQEVTFHHHFGDEPESFRAYVDRDASRILLSPQMYDAFRDHGVYPGARLRLSARSEQEFDLATRPTDKTERIHVWRMWLDEDGEVEYDDFEEPRRYDIDDDVYVADVRFEDRDALRQQAEQRGASIFQLMYEKAVEWWEENDRKGLVVTADQLHDAIHFDESGRMVSKATIGWELWKRLAFKPLGGGRYRFQARFGARKRSAVPREAMPRIQKPAPLEATAYFIFQQRRESEYADEAGEIYNWRRGIPGSRQIVERVAFIYYRPGEQVFFGTGRVASIDAYVGDDEETYYNGHISDYEPWDPPLPLTPQLAETITFIEPDRLGVGQAGIRKIDRSDFVRIRRAYAQARDRRQGPPFSAEDSDVFWKRIAGLEGQTLHTLDRESPFKVTRVTEKALRVELRGGTSSSLGRQKLEGAYRELTGEGEISRSGIEAFLRFNSSYAAAVLASLPAVEFRTDPMIRLFYRPGTASSAAPAAAEFPPVSEEVPSRAEKEQLANARIDGAGRLERTRAGQIVATSLVGPGPLFESPPTKTEGGEGVEGAESVSEGSSGQRAQPRIDAEFEQVRTIVEEQLVGQTVYTLAQARPNQILDSDDEGLTVLARAESIVRWEWVKDVYAALYHRGEIEPKDVQDGEFRTSGGYRCAFIFALLARFSHIEARTQPRRLIYHEPEGRIELEDCGDGDDGSEPPPRGTGGHGPSGPPSPGDPPSGPPTPPCQLASSSKRPGDGQTKALFSRHYLQNRLPDHPEWEEDPQAVFEALQELWRRAREYGDTWNESQTEQEFIQPVLELLGWAYMVQPKASHAGRVKRPDYCLFPDEGAKDEAMPHQGDDAAFYSRASAIAEAKYWGRPLSQKDAGGREAWDAQTNPSHQMVSYLVGTRVGWGILTNGMTWRLYSREVSSTASEYYEIDLRSMFASVPADGEPTGEEALVVMEQFRRWWLFFRQRSFVPDAEGRSFVERVREGSETYARRISDTLKKLVYEEVMPEIAGGFVAYRHHQTGVGAETEESLRDVYRASLSLLYKLLFLLYGEARALLPVDHPSYREQSVTALAQWAAERIDKGLAISDATHATGRYDALRALFRRIDRGDPSLGIPRYDGGLFDPSSPENEFLDTHKLSDRAVARAVDTLVRDAGEPVDYAYIGVQNLGSIYEGLLENRLRVVDAAAGQAGLISDQGERKATGSYYTPDYIVEYIVQNTLDPILEERDEAFRGAMDRSAELRGQLQRVSDAATVRRLRNELDGAEREAREAFLGIKVLDPAMGSGHFLVNAVDHLTDGIIRRMQVYHDEHLKVPWDWNPIQRLIEQVHGAILGEMERQGIQVDPARLDDTALLTRLVMKRCIYGVDLNRMAVELAKLSLWLHTFTVGAPLSFLDHHLRWGNSLIGTDVRTVEEQIRKTGAGQLSLWQGPFAGLLDLTGLMVEVVERADATLADVQRSAEIFNQFRRELTPYKQVLDLWVSHYFGNEGAEEFLTVHGADVLPALEGKQQVPVKYEAAIAEARKLYREQRFFHWDLEFPEVFVDLRRRDWAENPGFNAVIGNPPYGASFGKGDKSFLKEAYISGQGGYDSYLFFIESSCRNAQRGGYNSMIVPDTWLVLERAQALRRWMLTEGQILHLVDLPQTVFPDATVDACIFVWTYQPDIEERDAVDIVIYPHGARLDTLVNGVDGASRHRKKPDQWLRSRLARFRIQTTQEVDDLQQRIWGLSRRLGDVVESSYGVTPYRQGYGTPAQTGTMIEQDVYVAATQHDADWRPYLRGDDIGRYHLDWAGLFIKYGVNLAEPRDRRFFEGPRLMLQAVRNPSLTRRIIAAETDGGYVCNKNVAVLLLPQHDRFYVLALLNSGLINWFAGIRSSSYTYLSSSLLHDLPVRRIVFGTPPKEHKRLVAAGITRATEWTEPAEARSVERVSFSAFVDSDFGHWLDGRLSPVHTPDPELVRQHNADPLNEDWQLPEKGPVEQSDVVHDILAHLAEQMVHMHKERQSRVETFWLDLEGVTETSVYDTLRDRGKWESSLWKAEPCREFVDEESRSTVHVDESLGWNEACFKAFVKMLAGNVSDLSEVVSVYRKHHRDYGQLVRRIAATDRLIDLIVYRLYGLTAEEVAVVEGESP